VDVLGTRILTIGEVKKLLQNGGASLTGEAIRVERARSIALARPCRVRFSRHIVECGGFRVTGQHGQVIRDWDFGWRISQPVVCAEATDRNRLEGARCRLVQQCWNPVDGQIVGVLGVGAAGPELVAGGGADRDGIGAEEGVKVGLVLLAGEDDGIDVLVHKRRGNVDLGVSVCALHSEATGQQGGAEHGALHRHGVCVCRNE